MNTRQLKLLAKRIETFQSWRRGADIPMPEPRLVGIALDGAIHAIEELVQIKQQRAQKTK